MDKISIEMAKEELRKIRLQKEILYFKTLLENLKEVETMIDELGVMVDGYTENL